MNQESFLAGQAGGAVTVIGVYADGTLLDASLQTTPTVAADDGTARCIVVAGVSRCTPVIRSVKRMLLPLRAMRPPCFSFRWEGYPPDVFFIDLMFYEK